MLVDLGEFRPARSLRYVRALRKAKLPVPRVAIVGGGPAAAIVRLALSRAAGEARVFAAAERDRALTWLEGDRPPSGAGTEPDYDIVDEASYESFPASDPPGYTR